jgi:uncharacterized RDD family membrane protein YckC
MNYSQIYKRVLSFIVDAIIVGLIHYELVSYFGLSALNFRILDLANGMHLSISLLSMSIFIIYFTVFDASILKGSPGKKLFSIIIVNDDSTRITIYKSFLRSVLKLISFTVFFVGFIPAFFSDDKKSLHDKLLRTVVINQE